MNAASLLNHLWQSTAFALAAAGLAWTLRRHQARVRFWVWLAASVKFLLPFGALAALGALGALVTRTAPAGAPPAQLALLSLPFGTSTAASPTAVAPHAAGTPWLAILGTIWVLGSALLAARWLRTWLRLRRLARDPAQQGFEPGVFGIFRPVLLLPAGLAERLSAEQQEAVLAHERCHIRRRDNLWSALHMVVETLFWFHPLVWWIGARMVAERERACDEAVLGEGSDPAAYAGAVLEVCRHFVAVPDGCAAGISGGSLTRRIRSVMEGRLGARLTTGRKLVLAACAIAAVAAPLAAGMVWGQSAGPSAAQATAQGSAPTMFDAFTIKPAPPPSLTMSAGKVRIAIGSHYDPTRLTIENMSLRDIIQAAFELKPYQVVVPDWMAQSRFNLTAVTAAPATKEQMDELLKALIVEQFQIKSHSDSKEMSTYILTSADGGAKLKAQPPADTPPAMRIYGKGGEPVPKGAVMMALRGGGLPSMTLVGDMTVTDLATALSRQLDSPVLDQTGIAGDYVISLTYAPPATMGKGMLGGRMMLAAGGPPASPGDAASKPPETTDAAPPAPSLATALDQQLGLKLATGRGSVSVLVVDSAARSPIAH